MKEGIQKFGRFLSGMVMPNIAAFIAWGLITALFIETGWLPNAKFAALVGPMLTYLLPILIGYTGGHMIYKQRGGGVVAAIASLGVIGGGLNLLGEGQNVTMFLGVMIIAPIAGYLTKKMDAMLDGHVKGGFEMLVNNFSAGILGFILALIGMVVIGPVSLAINDFLGAAVDVLVENNMLPLTSIFVEPAKVLFLNNAINHGIFTPMGAEQVLETGKSIFYLIEANPGPGLGLLLAYSIFGKGMAKASAPGAAIIHFFGGIHEIYFPYVMMNPLLIVAMMAGGASGVFINVIFNSGLTGPASPGSIIAIMGMAEKGSFLGVALSVVVSCVVTFAVGAFILKLTNGKDVDLEDAQAQVNDRKAESKGIQQASTTITKVVFACDAGMGSSAMGATTLTKKLKDAGMDLKVEHYAIEEIPKDAQIIVTHQSLADRVRSTVPSATVMEITNFMGGEEYDRIVEEIAKR
ncbi:MULTISPECIES: PTS mannitol transporter subunit IICB [unclassified Breznakia]|uniref:PTS mannitol transporter subunit IICB n=1 Tax=unclassified Breznakia TaxID=2623764 RepID=UPI0024750D0D|nr:MULTISPECIES: PTS mannitol transporter subunit IICB [unclassified Breznakia]MDH6368069.1 PTS system mannitol-specific IIC component [Breznakia sp. PH1-1]MDH6405170.1 PTS system mannitol-specific IIC component [Breznakia sp. PF1-11]MDH6412872.1 PTS system mannitol-specific IIC component [Breznakia sp. PFB1-11]MDH6415246.1 PTS system mannitol-specific IIC component [Breznakia sp. PFB1-14]MDH6417556.1 PTS system mannitol-specific IIC component [Breznakia sp. PFB1-4]